MDDPLTEVINLDDVEVWEIHNFTATYWGPINYTGRDKLTATLEPGHTYLLKAERTESLITLWIEDLDTHEAVSERKTIKASSWVKFP